MNQDLSQQAGQAVQELLSRKEPEHWDSTAQSLQAGRLQVIALQDEAELLREGILMQHAVAWWTHRCTAGESRIFSILTHDALTSIPPSRMHQASSRQDNERVATMAIAPLKDRWTVVQVVRQRNFRPTQEQRDAAQAMADAYTAAS